MDAKRRLPLWVSNLFVFAFLFVFVVAYFFWQTNQAKKAFLDHAEEHAQLVAGVVQLNAQGAVFSQKVTEEILETFLSNTARFVDFLDSIEPFASEELTAFAEETGLAGVRVSRGSGNPVYGPAQWLPNLPFPCEGTPKLQHQTTEHLYLFSWPRQEQNGCVLIGVAATKIESLQQQLGIAHVTETISELPGICYVKMEGPTEGDTNFTIDPEVSMLETEDRRVAEVRLFGEDSEIVVGMCTDYLELTLKNIWRAFFIFSTALACLGIVLSLILYRQQSSYLRQAMTYERQISKEREDAALGRAAASIAHEVRNPLNSLGMGLQRLQMEGREITSEHQHLVGLMLDAVRRTNEIVNGLLNYARPQTPKLQSIHLDRLVENMLDLYQSRCQEFGIQVDKHIDFRGSILGDPDLLGQVVENLLRNAIEAQPQGGFLHLEVAQKSQTIVLTVKNGGFALPANEAEQILEPYFTTKIKGTGLGLAITQRIIQSHQGSIEVRASGDDTVAIAVYLPVKPELP